MQFWDGTFPGLVQINTESAHLRTVASCSFSSLSWFLHNPIWLPCHEDPESNQSQVQSSTIKFVLQVFFRGCRFNAAHPKLYLKTEIANLKANYKRSLLILLLFFVWIKNKFSSVLSPHCSCTWKYNMMTSSNWLVAESYAGVAV